MKPKKKVVQLGRSIATISEYYTEEFDGPQLVTDAVYTGHACLKTLRDLDITTIQAGSVLVAYYGDSSTTAKGYKGYFQLLMDITVGSLWSLIPYQPGSFWWLPSPPRAIKSLCWKNCRLPTIQEVDNYNRVCRI